MKYTEFNTDTDKPQYFILADEAKLRNIFADEAKKIILAMQNQKPQPYTRTQVMEVLHIKSTSLWNLQQNGTLHPYKIGGRMLFDKGEIDAVAQGKKGGYHV